MNEKEKSNRKPPIIPGFNMAKAKRLATMPDIPHIFPSSPPKPIEELLGGWSGKYSHDLSGRKPKDQLKLISWYVAALAWYNNSGLNREQIRTSREYKQICRALNLPVPSKPTFGRRLNQWLSEDKTVREHIDTWLAMHNNGNPTSDI